MTLSLNETRQLRGVAELLRGSPSPAVLEHVAAMLEAIVLESSSAAPGETSDVRRVDVATSEVAVELSKDAIRARKRRARIKAAKEAAGRAQLGLFAVATGRATEATALVDGQPSFAERSPTVATIPSLSLISSSSSKKSERARVELDPANMPANWAEHSRTLRPDLAAEHIARSWRRFALAKSGKFRSLQEAEGRWETWLEAERVRVDAPAPSSEAPTTKRAPAAKDVAQPTPSAAATAQWQRQQERDAMASRTMPITAKLAMARGPLEALQAVGASA